MRQSIFAFPLSMSFLCLLTACGSNTSSRVKLEPSVRGGVTAPGESSAAEKTLPAFKIEDHLVLLFNEMNRSERILRNVVRIPIEPERSCTKYVSTPTKRGTFLVMTYQKCGYTQELSGQRGKYAFQINGTETYERKSSRVDVRSQLTLLVGRHGAKRASMKPKANYALEASGDDAPGKTKTVDYISNYGNEKSGGEDFWTTSVDGGRWILTGDTDILKMAKGTSFKLVYRAGAERKNLAPTELDLQATEDITFAEACPWPISGAFEVHSKGEKPAMVKISSTGFTLGDAKTESKWPTDHCLGVKQN